MKTTLKTLLLFFFCVLINIKIHGQAAITFNKTYGNGVDNLFNVIELTDGYLGVMMSGFPFIPENYVVIKVDFNGDTLWQKYYGNSDESHYNYSLVKTYDGSFITGCHNYNSTSNILSIEILKFDSNGDSIWKKNIYAPPGFDYYPEFMIETFDHGFLISGQRSNSANNYSNASLLKTDSLGNFEWETVLSGNNFDGFYSSIQLPDKSYLSLGWTNSFGFGNNNNGDMYLVKTDSLGNFIWQKTFGTLEDETGIGITATSDGNYLLASQKYYIAADKCDSRITKIDTSGTVLWEQIFSTTKYNELWWARECYDKSIVAIGSKTNPLNQQDDGWIIKTDSFGNLQWERRFREGNQHCYFRDVKTTSDGGYIAAGFVFQGPTGTQDSWLVKLDSLGCDSSGCATYVTGIDNVPIKKQNGISVFPNPTKDFITCSFSQPIFTACRIRILNLLGSEVFKQTTFIQKQFTVPVHTLSNGVYVLEIFYEGEIEYVKFVKE